MTDGEWILSLGLGVAAFSAGLFYAAHQRACDKLIEISERLLDVSDKAGAEIVSLRLALVQTATRAGESTRDACLEVAKECGAIQDGEAIVTRVLNRRGGLKKS